MEDYVNHRLSVSALLAQAGRARGGVCHTARVKSYPDGSLEVLACDQAIFHPDGWETAGDRKRPVRPRQDAQKPKQHDCDNRERSMRRARAQVRDLALSNPFRWFVTLTLDQTKVSRYDMAEITRKLNAWLDNQVRRRGLAYVLVPERHKDGAIHFHGFFNDALEAVDSGHRDSQGHPVYNLPGWRLGFTTAIQLYGDYHAAVAYVCKYIGKQGQKPGGRWYYSGGNLQRPAVSFSDLSPRDLEAVAGEGGVYRFDVQEAGLSFAILRARPAPLPGGKFGAVVEKSNYCSSTEYPANFGQNSGILHFQDCKASPQPLRPRASTAQDHESDSALHQLRKETP